MTSSTIALVGDYSPHILAHRAIHRALALARDALGVDVGWKWIHTGHLRDVGRELASYAGVWVVPGSPYHNTPGALAAIQLARTTGRPFLGTCGGFQHALIEFARDVAGLPMADHAETNPTADMPVIVPLGRPLVDRSDEVRFLPGSQLFQIYSRETAAEGYHCSYGVNPAFRGNFERAGLQFTAFDASGEIRGFELGRTIHPFFIGTLFQPERAALRDELPPVVDAFVRAVAKAERIN
jgi:CTP synthase (UTP-ammonia lyase)